MFRKNWPAIMIPPTAITVYEPNPWIIVDWRLADVKSSMFVYLSIIVVLVSYKCSLILNCS